MSASDIQIAKDCGHMVGLERSGTAWQLPVEVRLSKGEWPVWSLTDVVWPGDRLILPEGRFVLAIVANPPADQGASFFERVYGRLGQLLLVVLSQTQCPACGTNGSHHVDVATDLSEIKRDVVRTCIACDNSWRQEAFG